MAKKGAPMGYIFPKKIQETIHGVNEDKIQIGYRKNDVKRTDGETWVDEWGKEWEVKNGIVRSVPKFADVRVPLFCPKCNRVMGKASKDVDVYYKFGFCLNCLIDRDIEMQNNGTFNQHEEQYIKSKQIGFYNDAKQEIESFLEQIKSGKLEFVNSDGSFEKWKGDETKLKEFWEKELEEVIKKINELENKSEGKDDV